MERGKPLFAERQERAIRVLGGQESDHAVRSVARERVGGLLPCLVHLREHPLALDVVDALCAWIRRRLLNPQGLDVLGGLRDLGVEAATRHIAEIAADHDGTPLGRHAVALLMRPPTHAVFTPPPSSRTS